MVGTQSVFDRWHEAAVRRRSKFGRVPGPPGVMLRNIEQGRFQRLLAGLTGFGAAVTGAEIWLEHDRASFGKPVMWLPVALSAPVGLAGFVAMFDRNVARTWLPITSAAALLNGLHGVYNHVKGVGEKPGGWRLARYNAEMGPPVFAPLLFTLVGGMGLVASILRREGRG